VSCRRRAATNRPGLRAQRGVSFTPASTLIVVKSLFHPDFLIEVEGVAAV
jgi:hypothetical protein